MFSWEVGDATWNAFVQKRESNFFPLSGLKCCCAIAEETWIVYLFTHLFKVLCFGISLSFSLSPSILSLLQDKQNYFCWRKCCFCPKCTALRPSACHTLMINDSASDLPESRQCDVSTPFIIVIYRQTPQTHSSFILRL